MQLKGFMQDNEVIIFTNEVRNSILKLKPKFDIINDISEFSPASPKGRELIKEAQAYAFQMKVGRVVRIVKNPTAKIQFDRSSKEAGYTAITVSSLQEANDYLDNNQ